MMTSGGQTPGPWSPFGPPEMKIVMVDPAVTPEPPLGDVRATVSFE
jgi:hypothetical protein